jgi:nucleoside triphosphate pyrophosphatase
MASLNERRYVLGSRSPRRLELLQQIVPPELIALKPPRSPIEEDFDGLTNWSAIETRLLKIARAKCADVSDQVRDSKSDRPRLVITADTVVIVGPGDGHLRVLGQPPDDPSWPEVVRSWFENDYAGRTHIVATAFCVAWPDRRLAERVVRSSVTFHEDVKRWLDWYLATSEPRGKAGGYAVQGAGSVFVSRVEGSLSNVVGLPLRELLDVLTEQSEA